MRVIPVLDVMDGVVVHGKAGQRSTYKPIRSRILNSAQPRDVARAFREQFGLDELYVADLNAIVEDRPQTAIWRELCQDGSQCLVDAGVRDLQRARLILDAGAQSVVIGLETLPHWDLLGELVDSLGSSQVVFSLDLQQGRAMGPAQCRNLSPVAIARQAAAMGIRRMLVLDLASVGSAQGVSTLDLCRQIRHQCSQLELLTGGGVRSPSDLPPLAEAGVDGVLIASALHSQSIRRADIEALGIPKR